MTLNALSVDLEEYFQVSNLEPAIPRDSWENQPSRYESNKEFITNAKEVFRLVNSVQLGIDISFDIFYCLGILFFSFSFLKLKGLGLLVGIIGVITSIGLLSLNMITFPHPPAESGLIDLGPYSIIWWVLTVIYIERIHNKPHKAGNKNTSV